MKSLSRCLAVILALPLQSLQAAYQSMPVKTRQVIYENGVRRCEVSRPSYSFRAEIVSDQEGLKPESFRHGRPFVSATSGERYAVRLYNPLPVRVAVNLTVDGLNSITGKPSGIKDGSKWVIEPYSFITIRGWQVNGEEARRFFFTEKPKSYAEWRGNELGKDLAANCGVIGAAYFWSEKELDAYYETHPQYVYRQAIPYGDSNAQSLYSPRAAASMDRLAEAKSFSTGEPKRQEAGTGMGERESNPTQTVQFDFDSGMYRLSQAIVIYYDFASLPVPNPFPTLSYAPEMP